MRDEETVVHGIAISRKNLIEIIVVAILLSFGVNLIANQFLILPIAHPIVTTLVGIVICLTSTIYISLSLFGKRIRSHTYEAFIISGPAKDNITFVPGYELSEEVFRFINSAFAENSALKSRWESVYSKSDLSGNESSDYEFLKFEPNEKDKLLIMAIEYFLLGRLSHHLDEYFHHKNLENITKYERKDIPSVLLSNSFLELFSRPMNERPAFVDFGQSDNTAAAWSGGAFYEKFELTLPRGSIIRRPEKNKIEIETKKLKVLMTVRFEGSSTVLPSQFEKYYLNLKLQQKVTPKGIMLSYGIYEIFVDIQITVKLRAMLSNIGWEYYEWVDSFLGEIEKDVSREAFFKRISWESNLTLLKCLEHYPNIRQTKSEKDKEVGV